MTVFYTGNIKNRKVYVTKPGSTSFLADGRAFVWGGDDDNNVDLARELIEHATGEKADNFSVLGRFASRDVAHWPRADPFTITDERIRELVARYGAEA